MYSYLVHVSIHSRPMEVSQTYAALINLILTISNAPLHNIKVRHVLRDEADKFANRGATIQSLIK